jgi:2-dehydro-3-deoxyphosphooctonate aldolase (KDO 8-P synthase)
MHEIKVGQVSFSNEKPLSIIAGPCVLESHNHALDMAYALKEITQKLGLGFVFKTSFDKANRTSIQGSRGIGLEESLSIFQDIKDKVGCPVVTDVHLPEHCAPIADVVDLLQIPAFLCRQTDLLLAAGNTKKPVHVKKGQFMAPWDMKNVVKKLESTGNKNILVCERGVSFGYNNLVVDMRSLPYLKQMQYPVIFDATHAVQQPGGLGERTGGDRRFVPILARAAVAVGVAGVFIETHDNPDQAPSDGPNMVHLKDMEKLLKMLQHIDSISKLYNENVLEN